MYYHTKQILKDKDKTVTEYKVIDKDKLTIDLDLEANHDYTLRCIQKSGLLATKRAISSVENIGFIISPLFYYSQLLFF